MAKLKTTTVFDRAHYPIGTAVCVETEYEMRTPSVEHGIITGYTDGDRSMLLITPAVCHGDRSDRRKISVESVEQGLIKLTRLLPEPPEMEDMDYQSTVNEMGWAYTNNHKKTASSACEAMGMEVD